MSYSRVLISIVFVFLTAVTTINAQADETTTIVSPPATTTTTVVSPSSTPNITTPAPAPSMVKGQPMIVTPVPSAKEVIATPEGYVNCFTVAAGWNKNAWVPEHKICRYENTPGQSVTYEGVAWIDSYWACTQYTGTACTKWEWKPGHWVKTLEVY